MSLAIRLIGVDVDGTLVGAAGQVPQVVWDAVRRVRDAGARLTLCSGRAAFGVALDYARQLDPDGWHIFQNGASIVHLTRGHSLSTQLPTSAVQALIADARRTGHVLELYGDTEYVTESTSTWAREHAELLGIAFEPRSFDTLQSGPVRAQWVVAPQDVPAVVQRVPANLEVAVSTSPIMPDVRFVGLTAAGISKGSALHRLSAEYGIPPEAMMYVGDAGNDLSALRIVGVPVAMANADTAVLAVAKFVAGDVEQAGLVDALEYALSFSGNR